MSPLKRSVARMWSSIHLKSSTVSARLVFFAGQNDIARIPKIVAQIHRGNDIAADNGAKRQSSYEAVNICVPRNQEELWAR